MKLSALKALASAFPDRDDFEVVIPLSKPSIGCIEYSKVTGVRFVSDMASDRFIIIPSKPLVVKSKEEDMFDAAVDLLLHLATKKSKRVSYETTEAQMILKRFGYTDKYFQDTTSTVNKRYRAKVD